MQHRPTGQFNVATGGQSSSFKLERCGALKNTFWCPSSLFLSAFRNWLDYIFAFTGKRSYCSIGIQGYSIIRSLSTESTHLCGQPPMRRPCLRRQQQPHLLPPLVVFVVSSCSCFRSKIWTCCWQTDSICSHPCSQIHPGLGDGRHPHDDHPPPPRPWPWPWP